MVKLKRVYDEPSQDDGTRILVDRLWPRGLTKEKAHIDLWLKEVAPSNELRNGSPTTQKNGQSSKLATMPNSIKIQLRSPC
jgi:uncharacterized protein YeaO (DUF488 family)